MSQRFTIVFTGTQAGMTDAQKKLVARVFARGDRLMHGCCTGADDEANALWLAVTDDRQTITGYPSDVPGKRAACLTGLNHAPRPPLERNRTMIDEALQWNAPLCVAAPKGKKEELRSGTWATVRYARKRGVPVFIAWPDGVYSYDPTEIGGVPPTEGHPK